MSTKNIKVVLVEPQHPGNIGAVARAMKTMGLSELRLVAPRGFPDEEAVRRAAGAADVLDRAHCYGQFEEAIADCALVVGTTARERSIEWPLLQPAQAAESIVNAGRAACVALLFGRERSGLTNAEVDSCQYLTRIPADPHYSSLNLAAAVQIMAYEIRLRVLQREDSSHPLVDAADAQTVAAFYQHLEQTLYDIDFIKTEHPPVKLMRKLRRLFNRARPTNEEINILRGILAAVQPARRAPQ